MPFTDDLPRKSQVFDHWKERLGELGFFVDWGEPGCWACGFHYDDKYDITQSDARWDEILGGWDRIPLQRCHIIPRSLGGTDDVSNLFLMCRECHDLAPNTSIPEVFFEWTRAQNHYRREFAKFRAASNSFGIGAAKENELVELINSDNFKLWLSGKYGLHRPQSNYAPRSSRLTPATIIGLAVQYQRTSKAS